MRNMVLLQKPMGDDPQSKLVSLGTRLKLRHRRSKCSVYMHILLKLCNILSSERGNPRALPEEIGWIPWENIEKAGM